MATPPAAGLNTTQQAETGQPLKHSELILAIAANHPEGITRADIIEQTGVTKERAWMNLTRLADQGRLRRIEALTPTGWPSRRNTRFYAIHATTAPATVRPVCGQPDFKPAATDAEIADLAQESGCPPQPDPASAGWDISYGCRLNYGHSPDGPLVVNIQLGPDYDGTGIIRREVTPEQLIEHAQHLLRVARDELVADKTIVMAAIFAAEAAITSCEATTRHLGAAEKLEEAP